MTSGSKARSWSNRPYEPSGLRCSRSTVILFSNLLRSMVSEFCMFYGYGPGILWKGLDLGIPYGPPAVGWPLDATAALGVFYFPDG